MKLKFHGGAMEVGRSCIELETEGDRFLLDSGLKFKEDGFEMPENIFELNKIDGMFLSHAHLDHSGALPLFEHFNLICPIYTTQLTKNITKILLKDSYKIERIRHLHPAYEKKDIKKVWNATKLVKFNKKYKIKNMDVQFFNAGHIPGSASVLIEAEGKRILYSGDINSRATELMKPLNENYGEIDAFIVEATYGDRTLPEQKQIEEDFLNKVEETLSRGGSVLIPVFALGRAQETLIVLSKRKFSVPIYYDGMAKKVTREILDGESDYINNKSALSEMFNSRVIFVSTETHRDEILKKQGIYVTTSGMMQGGPVLKYLEKMWGNPKHSILLMGYQCKRTNGRTLLEEHYIYLNGWKTYVKCEVQKYDFSGHIDEPHLKELIKKVNPKLLILQHGDETPIMHMKEWAESENIKTLAPKVNDIVEL